MPVCIARGGDDTLLMLHPPSRPSGTAVLIVPPFGWQEACSYRPLRTWAQALAGAGHAAARLTLPGTGDAAGDVADPPDALPGWRAAVAEAAERLRADTGCERLVALGIGAGGMLAVLALSDGVDFDDLILWNVPARGRRLLRELVGESRIIAAAFPEDDPDEDPGDGTLELAGYRLGAATAEALRSLDLTAAEPARGGPERVLVFGRDGIAPDEQLLTHFRAQGAEVEIASGDEYAAMMAQPQDSMAPGVAIAASLRWLAGREVASPIEPSAPAEPTPRATAPSLAGARSASGVQLSDAVVHCAFGDTPLRERPLWVDTEHGRLFGILTEAVDGTGTGTGTYAVLVGAGALVHTGPSRNWVQIARRSAAAGLPAIRIDLSGVGESGGSAPGLLDEANLYAEWRDIELREALDALANAGLGDRFVLGGLCAGAYQALRRALADERVCGVWLLNLYAVRWSAALVAERVRHSAVTAALPNLRARLARGDVARKLVALARPDRMWRLISRSGERREARETIAAFEALQAREVETLVVLSRAEALRNVFARGRVRAAYAGWTHVTTVLLESRDHMIRARSLREEISAAIDASVQRVLEHAPPRD